jgi:hypothetical protein
MILMIDKGIYVRIRKTILKPNERSENLPKETKQVPYKMWVKGYLQKEADLFDLVIIKTVTGRIESGILKEVEPPYKHSYGDFVPELSKLTEIILNDVYGDKNE